MNNLESNVVKQLLLDKGYIGIKYNNVLITMLDETFLDILEKLILKNVLIIAVDKDYESFVKINTKLEVVKSYDQIIEITDKFYSVKSKNCNKYMLLKDDLSEVNNISFNRISKIDEEYDILLLEGESNLFIYYAKDSVGMWVDDIATVKNIIYYEKDGEWYRVLGRYNTTVTHNGRKIYSDIIINGGFNHDKIS